MRLRHIEVFNAVMQTGSVSAAARLINVTQPAVSRTLQHAELQLGFALFERARGRLTPTNEAMALFPHVEKLYEQLDEVQRLAAGLRHGAVTDRLQVLTVFALSREVLPHAVAGFRKKYPQVQVTVQALHTPQVVSGLLLQEADVGFVISSAGQHALERESLAEVDMHCIVPKGLLPPSRIKPAGMALQDLADLPVVALDARDPLGMRINQACREHGVGLSPVVTVQTYHAALSMAEYGLGIAIVDGCTASAADPRKVHVLPLLPRITVSVNALHLAQRPSSVLARAMTQEMRKALRELL
ncbi:LysR substrate-binding domain-containing protein [Comamonas aquatica]|uniref:LysR substrate-binding domain-containing protein n=1 Tax=Comamonas aquatica TaxID=225991 RepID=UPI0028D57485|nr:LysR substrate-binding domain-containing protein [Comamonas aquatica]